MTSELIRRIDLLERRLDGLVKPEVGRWVDWTPTVTQGVAVTITITYARYIIINNTVHMVVSLIATSAGTAANDIRIRSIPSIIAPVNFGLVDVIGGAIVQDVAITNYHGGLVPVGVDDFRILVNNNTGHLGTIPAFTLANGDNIAFQGTYER